MVFKFKLLNDWGKIERLDALCFSPWTSNSIEWMLPFWVSYWDQYMFYYLFSKYFFVVVSSLRLSFMNSCLGTIQWSRLQLVLFLAATRPSWECFMSSLRRLSISFLSFFNSHPSNWVFFTPYELEIESVSSALACSWSKDEVIKCSSCLVFKWHSYTKPLRIRPHFDHFNTKLVLSSDPHCVTSLPRAALEV